MDNLQLLGGKYRPITNTLGFLECSAERAAQTFWEWRDKTYSRNGRILRIERVTTDGLAAMLELLLPLRTWEDRWLFIETNSAWCAFVENGFRGVDSGPMISLGRYRCKCRSIRATSIPTGMPAAGYPACILEVVMPTPDEAGNIQRSVCAMDDGGRWIFETTGTPYSFEITERYDAPRKRDRFTHEMLVDYLRHFGIDAFDEAFYRSNNGCTAYLVHIEGPPLPGNEEHPLSLSKTSSAG
jgi:hypothetical protein